MNEQYIQWTYEGEKKMVLLELGKECSVKKVQPIENPKVSAKHLNNINTIKEVTEPKDKGSGCSSCEENKRKNGLMHLAKGGAKLLKAQLGIDASDEDTINERKALCISCEHYDFGVCNSCGCFCSAKVRLKTEKCPIGKW
jgi:hypothetical protein